jgi:hypothetical protein
MNASSKIARNFSFQITVESFSLCSERVFQALKRRGNRGKRGGDFRFLFVVGLQKQN